MSFIFTSEEKIFDGSKFILVIKASDFLIFYSKTEYVHTININSRNVKGVVKVIQIEANGVMIRCITDFINVPILIISTSEYITVKAY